MRATHSYTADVIESIFHGISWTLLIIYQNYSRFSAYLYKLLLRCKTWEKHTYVTVDAITVMTRFTVLF